MTQKERLVELLSGYPLTETAEKTVFLSHSDAEDLADHLLFEGVIVPPCKVGDTVYSIGWLDNTVHKEKVDFLSYNSEEDLFWFVTDATSSFNSQDIGVCEFFSREEAEQALKERQVSNNGT